MKNKHLFISIFIFLITISLSAQETKNIRLTELFNFGWKFHLGDLKDAEKAQFDDGSWTELDLPHDFQINQLWDKSASPARGFKKMETGWYRKTFKANPEWKGKRVFVDFEGIMLTGDAYLNGEKIGGTDYGYLGFESDITKKLHFDGENVMAVRASTGENGNSRWYTGGGIFRDVHIFVKDTVAVARHGVFITTSNILEQNADVNVQVEVEGIRGKKLNVEIITKIFSPDGKQVGETKKSAPQKSKKSTDEVLLPAVNIVNPQLWSCETPNLYTAKVTLTLDGEIVDEITQKFGIRTVEFSKEFGFKLNGKKVFLKGIANHHDLGAVGAAAYETSIGRQFDLLKSFGFNAVRTSHNPYSEAFLRLADEKGILIVDEIYDKWSNKDYWAGRIPWTEIWYKNIPEWIKRDRNHPSVILWSFGNELQIVDNWAGFPTNDWGVTTYKILKTLAERYDPTRKTTVAMFPARAGALTKSDPDFNIKVVPPELATVTDVSSFNYRWISYPEYLKQAPDMIIFQSEATTNELGAPFYGMDREKMVGLAYWGAIDYWGESNGYPWKGWHYSFFDHTLKPYPQAYLIKSIFTDEPVVHIGVVDKASESMDWNEQTIGTMNVSDHWDREEGKKYNILTFTNADEVELLINGKSVGIKQNDTTDVKKRNMIFWQNVPYEKGKITAVARKNGKEVARHQLETTGKAVALKIEAENNDFKANGMDLKYVRVYAVDNKGRVVPEAENEITFDVSGVAKLIAVDNGDHKSDELFDTNKRKLNSGCALAILRAGKTTGQVKIKASAQGLKSVEKILFVK
ncbi:Beta-galactosidase [uncultured Paludibacter sp.]|uniref:Beta-galactosidase n=1 Tax=uncultured Paludibacter sp. TaxID=497635 RepID=A0A653AIU9_9BACT|nr:Beta-galactosidase [uncultured Paludibacter sp.]